MSNRPARRKLIVVILLCVAVGGAVLRHFATPGSTARDLGTLLMLLWIPVIGNVVAWLFARMKQARAAAAVTPEAAAAAALQARMAMEAAEEAERPFRAQVIAEITLRPAPVPADDLEIAEGEHRCAFVVDNQGFTARWRVPAGKAFRRGTAQTLEVAFLAPSTALPKFTPGTAFRMLVGEAFVGDGRVKSLAGPAGTAAIGTEPAKPAAE